MIVNTKAGAESEGEGAEDPRFAQAVKMIESIDDASRLEQMIGMFSAQVDKVEDPERKERMEKLLEIANERLKTLKAAEDE
jgi:hypothetical protein